MSLAPALAALPDPLAATIVRTGDSVVLAVGAGDAVPIGYDPFAQIDRIGEGWWAGFAAYELGHRVERVVPRRSGAADPAAVPELALVRFEARVEITAGGSCTWWGHGAERRALERALDAPGTRPARPGSSGRWSSSLDEHEYEAGVRAVQDLIRRGDCYQVNLTRRLTGPPVDPVALWSALERNHPAPHGTFWRDGAGFAVVSASPERFLGIDGASVETRPIKGTGVEAAGLMTSKKDRAENVMIVDLARNDLGRVCTPGSVVVPELCRVERHPGLVHLVSTVRGRRRPDVGLGALLRATFPPASITGAPKPRVMQTIEDLEPVPRGVYCGALGWFDADRDRADFAVAIRTFTCTPATTTLGVGAGITIDSEPAAEWAETELKAARLLPLAGERRGRTLAGTRP